MDEKINPVQIDYLRETRDTLARQGSKPALVFQLNSVSSSGVQCICLLNQLQWPYGLDFLIDLNSVATACMFFTHSLIPTICNDCKTIGFLEPLMPPVPLKSHSVANRHSCPKGTCNTTVQPLSFGVCFTLSATWKKILAETGPNCTSITLFFKWFIDPFLIMVQTPQHSYTLLHHPGSGSGHCAEGAGATVSA